MDTYIESSPKICIVMPCYNHAQYLGQAIESVLNQTYGNLELNIINDGSTDNTKEVIQKYLGDSRVIYHEFTENTNYFGVIRMYDSCFRNSDAKYAASIASDDMWTLDKLEKQVNFLEAHPNYKACFTWDQVVHEENPGSWLLPDNYSEQINRSRYEWFYFFLFWGNRLNACSMLMDRLIYLELGGYNPSFRAIGDLYLWMLLTTKYSFYIIPEKLTYYRRHGTNLSTVDGRSLQLVTEDYLLSRRLITEMDKDFFHRAFSHLMVYADLDNPYVLTAEKIILLIGFKRCEYDQIAMELYIENAADKNFAGLMEQRYGFTTKEFNLLMRNCGLASAALNLPRGHTYAPPPNRATILLSDISSQKFTPERLCVYSYSFLLDTVRSKFIIPGFKPDEFVNLAKTLIYSLQKDFYLKKEKKKAVFIVGNGSGWDSIIEDNQWLNPAGDEIYYSVIPKTTEIFNDNAVNNYIIPPEKNTLKMFIEEEHFFASAMDMGVNPDIIVFVDCLGEEYSWEYIMRKYSLDVLFMYIDTGAARINPEEPIVKYLDRIGK